MADNALGDLLRCICQIVRAATIYLLLNIARLHAVNELSAKWVSIEGKFFESTKNKNLICNK